MVEIFSGAICRLEESNFWPIIKSETDCYVVKGDFMEGKMV